MIELDFYVGRLGIPKVSLAEFRWCQLRQWLKPPNIRVSKLFKSHPTFNILEDQKCSLLSTEIFDENSVTISILTNEHCATFFNAKIHSAISLIRPKIMMHVGILPIRLRSKLLYMHIDRFMDTCFLEIIDVVSSDEAPIANFKITTP